MDSVLHQKSVPMAIFQDSIKITNDRDVAKSFSKELACNFRAADQCSVLNRQNVTRKS